MRQVQEKHMRPRFYSQYLFCLIKGQISRLTLKTRKEKILSLSYKWKVRTSPNQIRSIVHESRYYMKYKLHDFYAIKLHNSFICNCVDVIAASTSWVHKFTSWSNQFTCWECIKLGFSSSLKIEGNQTYFEPRAFDISYQRWFGYLGSDDFRSDQPLPQIRGLGHKLRRISHLYHMIITSYVCLHQLRLSNTITGGCCSCVKFSNALPTDLK